MGKNMSNEPEKEFCKKIEERLAHLRKDNVRDYIDLSDCGIDTQTIAWVVARLLRFESLQSLDLSNNKIESEGALVIGRSLMGLKMLDLVGNAIGNDGTRSLVKSLNALTSLDVAYNWIENSGARAIAKSLGRLRTLGVSHNPIGNAGIRAIAKSLKGLTSLDVRCTSMGISGARAITDYLRGLTSLFIGGNSLGEAGTAGIASLVELTTLDISDNAITEVGVVIDLIERLLPASLGGKFGGALSKISVKLNPLRIPAGNRIDLTALAHAPQPVEEVVRYLRDATAVDAVRVPEARIVFIGTGENGKSQLAGALAGRIPKNRRVTERTKGVDVEPLKPIATRAHGAVTCRIFDCGGQPEQYQIHRAFWEALRNVMVLVVDACKPSGWRGAHALTGEPTVGNRVDYFLRMIEAEFNSRQVKPPAILVVLTHGDQLPAIDSKHIGQGRSKYPTIGSLNVLAEEFRKRLVLRVVQEPVDALHQIGLESVRESLATMLETTDGLSATVPRTFAEVRARVQRSFGTFEEPKDQVPGMSMEEFSILCLECGESDPERPGMYLRILASLGDVIHDETDSELCGLVLNIHWARKALYELLTHDLVKNKRGQLNDVELDRVLPKANREMIRQLSESLQIMFRVQGTPDERTGRIQDNWLVPQVLPFKEMPHRWITAKATKSLEKGRFLSEVWFLHQVGKHAHLITDPQTEAFRDEVVFTEPSGGAKAVLRPDYESEPMAIHIYANPEDKTGMSPAWCERLTEQLVGRSPSLRFETDAHRVPEPDRRQLGKPFTAAQESLACAYLIAHPMASKAEIAREVGFSASVLSTKGRWKEFAKLWEAMQQQNSKNPPNGIRRSDGSVDAFSDDE